jgi:hypothetical protein
LEVGSASDAPVIKNITKKGFKKGIQLLETTAAVA